MEDTFMSRRNLPEFLFVNDDALREVLEHRYVEMTTAFDSGLSQSAVFLAVSILEGIFRYLTRLYQAPIKASDRFEQLKLSSGLRARDVLRNMTLEHMYECLNEVGAVQLRTDFDRVFAVARAYRNFIHPTRQAKEGAEIGAGEARIANGVLEVALRELGQYRIWCPDVKLRVISGQPVFRGKNLLHLPGRKRTAKSFLISERPVENTWVLCARAHLTPGSILNFVLNFHDEESFRFLRLDTRNTERASNGILQSSGPNSWRYIGYLMPKKAKPGWRQVDLTVDVGKEEMFLSVDGQLYCLEDDPTGNLYGFFLSECPVGMFSQQGAVSLDIERFEIE